MTDFFGFFSRPLWNGAPITGAFVLIAAGALIIAVVIGCLIVRRKKKRAAAEPFSEPAEDKNADASKEREEKEETTFVPNGNSTGEKVQDRESVLVISNLQGIGKREQQQDAFGLSPMCEYEEKGVLAVLCDGMGGMEDGGNVARFAVSEMLQNFPFHKLGDVPELISSINDAIFSEYKGRGGTTLVCAYIFEGKLWFWCVGDSDLFLFRNGRIYGMNCRHEQGNKLLTEAIAGTVTVKQVMGDPKWGALTEYLGNVDVNADFSRSPFALEKKDVLFLCSDGISDTLSLAEIEEAMRAAPDARCAALENGILQKDLNSQDNYTGIVIEY